MQKGFGLTIKLTCPIHKVATREEKAQMRAGSGAAPGLGGYSQMPLPAAISQGIDRQRTRPAKDQRHQAGDI